MAKDAARLPEVRGAAPYVQAQGMLSFNQNVRGAMVRGVLPDLEDKVADFRPHMKSGSFDALVLDVMLPGIDGLTFCRLLRSKPGPNVATPVLFLSARSDEVDRVVGLELGADDYLTKPFSPRELAARIRAILRRCEGARPKLPDRSAPSEPAEDKAPKLVINRERHEVRWGHHVVELTVSEFGLLSTLYERTSMVWSRGQLLDALRSYEQSATERLIDTHVKRIRGKFRNLGVDPIATVHGVGYRAAVD